LRSAFSGPGSGILGAINSYMFLYKTNSRSRSVCEFVDISKTIFAETNLLLDFLISYRLLFPKRAYQVLPKTGGTEATSVRISRLLEMPVFTVPLNYDETVDHLIVPICVSDVDDEGNRVHFEWIQHAVAPIADKLVRLAGSLLHDWWRASEITEPVVHQLSRDFGVKLGVDPSARVLCAARWHFASEGSFAAQLNH
jgi:hypothetical protein